MHSTSLYGLKLSVLRGVGAKALATDHREPFYAPGRKTVFFGPLRNKEIFRRENFIAFLCFLKLSLPLYIRRGNLNFLDAAVIAPNQCFN